MKDTVGRHDHVLKFLRDLHKNNTISDQLCRNPSVSSSGSSSSGSNSARSSASKYCILRDWAIVGTNDGERRNRKSQNEMWSVYDYSLVWGKKHAYAAASITVSRCPCMYMHRD